MFRYFGSKATTSPELVHLFQSQFGSGTVADAYGGLGTVGVALKQAGFQVTTCDVLKFPHAFQTSRIQYDNLPAFRQLRRALGLSTSEVAAALNRAKAPESWLVYEYAIKRRFFTRPNAVRIAGAWHLIRRWTHLRLVTSNEQKFLIASLLNSADKVANTAGTYYAYLKDYHRKALRPFVFQWIAPAKGPYRGVAVYGDALKCLSGRTYKVLYLDPPYNDRDYARYYHLPESMAGLNEVEIKASSLSGVPAEPHPATPSIKMGASLEYLHKLLEQVKWKNAVVHYCDDAIIPLRKLRQTLQQFGGVRHWKIEALGYTTKSQPRSAVHHVYVVSRD